MTGVRSLFPRASFVGFDHFLAEVDMAAKQASENYPPHNVVKVTDVEYLIEMAVAGFSQDELGIEVVGSTLTVTGEHVSKNRSFIHRGISTKKFKRVFRLSEYTKVVGANLVDGVLAIELEVVLPEEKRPRKVDINFTKSNEVQNEKITVTKSG
jgi:molecular chaperone IbpA|tara:strand:- start:18838 stop:19299 length:462 start_codon:yes stop_codon:yes gene_type:complete